MARYSIPDRIIRFRVAFQCLLPIDRPTVPLFLPSKVVLLHPLHYYPSPVRAQPGAKSKGRPFGQIERQTFVRLSVLHSEDSDNVQVNCIIKEIAPWRIYQSYHWHSTPVPPPSLRRLKVLVTRQPSRTSPLSRPDLSLTRNSRLFSKSR